MYEKHKHDFQETGFIFFILINNLCHNTLLFFLPTFTCLMLHKRHLNIFLTLFWWPDFQKLGMEEGWRWNGDLSKRSHEALTATSYNSHLCCTTLRSYLHGNVCGLSGMTLQVLISATASAPHQGNAGGAVDVLHLRWVFLHHLHQLLNGAAKAATPNFFKHKHCE